MTKINPLFAIDFYKADHRRQYPEGTEYVYSNFTPRSERLFHYEGKLGYVVAAGISSFIQTFLVETFRDNFFARELQQVVAEYKEMMDEALGPDAFPLNHIIELHELGYLPLGIRALPEGTFAPIGTPIFTIVNTDPRFFWLTNYIETVVSAEVWKISTVATIAHYYRLIGEKYADLTGVPKEVVDFQFHDFSFRGLSGLYDAASSGVGHLFSFTGTDNVLAIDHVKRYYKPESPTFIAGSVPATEHSVMCVGGEEDEIETFRRLLNLYPTGIVSIVSDTWDFWRVISEYTVTLKDEIMARQPNAIGLNKVVFRPDSGDPVKILTGYTRKEGTNILDNPGYEVYQTNEGFWYKAEDWEIALYGDVFLNKGAKALSQEEVKGAVEVLWDIFGGTETDKGFKVLDEHVGLIYGDSITLDRAEQILQRLADKGFASSNVVFGVGSYTYQYITRDTFGFAMKATWAQVNGVGRNIQKNPKTDSGTKKSRTGLLRVLKTKDRLVTLEKQNDVTNSLLRPIFFNGVWFSEGIDTIRKRIKDQM